MARVQEAPSARLASCLAGRLAVGLRRLLLRPLPRLLQRGPHPTGGAAAFSSTVKTLAPYPLSSMLRPFHAAKASTQLVGNLLPTHQPAHYPPSSPTQYLGVPSPLHFPIPSHPTPPHPIPSHPITLHHPPPPPSPYAAVAFINILKALTPAVTLIASMALGMERPSLRVMASLGLIALGTSIATAQVRSMRNGAGGWPLEERVAGWQPAGCGRSREVCCLVHPAAAAAPSSPLTRVR